VSTVSTKTIRQAGRDIILQYPGGIRFRDLVTKIIEVLPGSAPNSVETQVANQLVAAFPNEITKPSRGLYRPLSPDEPVAPEPTQSTVRREEDVYAPFASWLANDLEEATEAVALGGAGLRTKWGTPDVVGVYRPHAAQLIKFTPEIVAAEIKIDPGQPIVAFGQAIAYRLFAARTYVVMPSTMTEEDQSRLEALCSLFGVGFVLFDPKPGDPEFRIRTRAQRYSPDVFYVNEFATKLHALDSATFQKLFG